MKILISEVKLMSPGSKFNGAVKDVMISNGIISRIEEAGKIPHENFEFINGKGLYLSPGWFDLHAHFREPGEEHKEDLISGCKAAMQGGFTDVVCMPSPSVPSDNRSVIEYIQNKTKNELCKIHAAGTLSKKMQGKDLSEMFDMFNAGALVFTDDKLAIQDAGLLLRAMQYVQSFGAKIFVYPNDKSISGQGQMHEGSVSTSLGLKGIPALAEELMISRDISLAEYSGATIHFSTISTKNAVEQIRAAKNRGLKVTADVSSLNISLTHELLTGFDSKYKVHPPLRTKEDVLAIIDGLKDGTIDAISSDHSPQDIENKKREFELAAYGAGNLETSFAAAYTTLSNHLSDEQIIDKFTNGPRRIMGLKDIYIEENIPACLTLFDLNKEWTVQLENIFSRSKNNPFLNTPLIGKAVAVFNNEIMYRCQ